MKNLEKGAVTNFRLLLHQSRVFARFLQRKFLRRRNVTKAGKNSSSPSRKETKLDAHASRVSYNATKTEQTRSENDHFKAGKVRSARTAPSPMAAPKRLANRSATLSRRV